MKFHEVKMKNIFNALSLFLFSGGDIEIMAEVLSIAIIMYTFKGLQFIFQELAFKSSQETRGSFYSVLLAL